MTNEPKPIAYGILTAVPVTYAILLGNAQAIVLAILCSPIYFLPILFAEMRQHHQMKAIVALTILLGWTFLGWAAALVWSLTAVQRNHSPSPSSS